MSGDGGAVRFGVIGCGVIAYWSHLRSLRGLSGAQLVAAADPDEKARQQAQRLTGVDVHADASELLARADVDAVVISAPTNLHAMLGIAAAGAGKHVYLEKPVAADAVEAGQFAAAVRAAGVHCAIGFNRRCHPLYLQARDLIRSGAVGEIRSVFSSFNEPLPGGAMPSWKRRRASGGGVLLDLGSHHADLVRWFLDDEVEAVEARIGSRATEDDEAWMRLTLRGGVTAQGFFSFRAGRADFMEFFGEHGVLRVDRHRPSVSLRVVRRFGYGVRSAMVRPTRQVFAWQLVRLARPSYEPSYRKALEDFVKRIRGRSSHGASLGDGLKSLDIILAAEESSRQGRSQAPAREAD